MELLLGDQVGREKSLVALTVYFIVNERNKVASKFHHTRP